MKKQKRQKQRAALTSAVRALRDGRCGGEGINSPVELSAFARLFPLNLLVEWLELCEGGWRRCCCHGFRLPVHFMGQEGSPPLRRGRAEKLN